MALAVSGRGGHAVCAEQTAQRAAAECRAGDCSARWARARKGAVLLYGRDHGDAEPSGNAGLSDLDVRRRSFAARKITPARLDGPLVLNEAQQAACDGLTAQAAQEAPGVALLYGVTGSGKTSVYIQLIVRCLAAGRSAILLGAGDRADAAAAAAVCRAFRRTGCGAAQQPAHRRALRRVEAHPQRGGAGRHRDALGSVCAGARTSAC